MTLGLIGDSCCLARNKNHDFRGFLNRMKGLDPSTFCMANASDRSRPFAPLAQTGCLHGFCSNRANTTAPERTPNLAILATAGRSGDSTLAHEDVALLELAADGIVVWGDDELLYFG